MPKVFIGVGHGGQDGGASAYGLVEKNLNLTIALSCYDELKRHKIELMISRVNDATKGLYEYIKECNNFRPHLAIDIHNNAGGGDGQEIYYHYNGGMSLDLAKNIEQEIGYLGQNSRGCKTRKGDNGRDYYAFIRETVCPSVIVECAFLDSADRFIIDEEEEQKAFGIAIAKGILKTLGVPFIPNTPPTTNNNTTNNNTTNENVLYRVVSGSYKEYKNAQARIQALKEKGFEAFIDVVKK